MSEKNKGIGKKFENGVKEGLTNGNWDGLNEAIIELGDTFIDGVGDKIDEALSGGSKSSGHQESKNLYSDGDMTREWASRLREERKQRRHEMEEERAKREAQREARKNRRGSGKNNTGNNGKNELGFPYRPVGEVSSGFYSISGGIGVGFVGVLSLVNLVTAAWGPGNIALAGVFMAIFAGMLTKGVTSTKLNQRADRYAKLVGDKGYIEIRNLALLTNQTPRAVIRDIKKMLKKGFFPEGHLDEGNTTFILTDSVFHQYLEMKKSAAVSRRENIIDSTAREVDEEFENLSPEQAAELKQMIAEGKAYTARVHELNEVIPGEVMSGKLSRLEGLLNEIFARVKEHPEQMSKMHELMDYYLPTAIKIVEAYSEYDDVSEPGAEIVKAQSDIENTVETINVALSKLLNNLFKDSVWDVTTDAQVLKTVLAQKGLSGE